MNRNRELSLNSFLPLGAARTVLENERSADQIPACRWDDANTIHIIDKDGEPVYSIDVEALQ